MILSHLIKKFVFIYCPCMICFNPRTRAISHHSLIQASSSQAVFIFQHLFSSWKALFIENSFSVRIWETWEVKRGIQVKYIFHYRIEIDLLLLLLYFFIFTHKRKINIIWCKSSQKTKHSPYLFSNFINIIICSFKVIKPKGC